MIGQVPLGSVQTQKLFTEITAYNVAVPHAVGTETNLITTLATGHARELVVMVSASQNITIIKRMKAAQQLISVDRVFAHVGGTDSMDQDVMGFGDEIQILAINTSGTDTTVTIKVLARQ